MACVWPTLQEYVDADVTASALEMMFGGGNCARPGCVRPAQEGWLMCKTHWWLVTRPLREKVWRTYRAYTHGHCDLDALRRVQQEAVDAVVKRSTA